ncbi:MAG: hypothetical protein C4549_05570 [Deltaproteobacteria bacterium]|jgi:hypothetical protein|nr:MAG: hypothetical protein C4549_05570 [Deltaproteobacteria bacterium]
MATVREVNEAFLEKGLEIELPFPDDWLVKKVDILEKRDSSDKVGVLLALKLIDDMGREISELYYGESLVKRERKVREAKIEVPSKTELLPLRSKMDFDSDEEAWSYIKGAFIHLLKDKGYSIWGDNISSGIDSSVLSLLEKGELDIYAEKDSRGFLIRVALRSTKEDAYKKAIGLVELRKDYGSLYDYGLVIPAFQDSLGVKWRDQEFWLTVNSEYLSIHRIGLFAVDNLDPNRVYPHTVYAKEREIFRYMVNSSRQWSVVRGRYLQQRASRVVSSK